MAWRRLLRAYHRDVGYFVSALTLSYCVSGLAVNHMAQWNPNYQILRSEHRLPPLTGGPDDMQRTLITQLGLKPNEVRGRLQQSPKRFKLFLDEGGEAVADVTTGEVTLKLVRTRPGLFAVNALHLNHLKGVWTYIADAFAVLLASLALSGLVMLRGQTGFAGRGKWITAAGLLVPVVSFWLLSS